MDTLCAHPHASAADVVSLNDAGERYRAPRSETCSRAVRDRPLLVTNPRQLRVAAGITSGDRHRNAVGGPKAHATRTKKDRVSYWH